MTTYQIDYTKDGQTGDFTIETDNICSAMAIFSQQTNIELKYITKIEVVK